MYLSDHSWSGQNHLRTYPFFLCFFFFCLWFALFYLYIIQQWMKCFMEREEGKESFIFVIKYHWVYFIFKIRLSNVSFMKVKLGKNKLHELALPASQPEQYLIALLQQDFGMHIWKYQMEYLKCKVQAKTSLWKIIVSHWCLIVTSHQKKTQKWKEWS